MSSYDQSIGQLRSDSHEHDYFYDAENFDRKHLPQRPTQDHDSDQQQFLGLLFKNEPEEIDKKQPAEQKLLASKIPRVAQNKIRVSPQARKKYLESKKGRNQKTADLTVNMSTLLKSSFDQFLTFFYCEESEVGRIQQFKTTTPNLKSIRKLLGLVAGPEEDRNSSNNQSRSMPQNGGKFKGLDDFLSQFLKHSRTLKRVMLSKKMSFFKKKMILKHLDTLQQACSAPEKLLGWKVSL